MGYEIVNGVKYGIGKDDKYVEVTQAEYDALPSSKAHDNTNYIITDVDAMDAYNITYKQTTVGDALDNLLKFKEIVIPSKTTNTSGYVYIGDVFISNGITLDNIISVDMYNWNGSNVPYNVTSKYIIGKPSTTIESVYVRVWYK